MIIDLSKYKDFDIEKAPLKLNNREAFVVGKEIDENNHLWYVISENGELSVIDAENTQTTPYYSAPTPILQKAIKT